MPVHIRRILYSGILLQLAAGCCASDVCSLANNPCLTALETSRELNFIYGLTDSQLRNACDIFGKSIHCLDYSLRSCTSTQRDALLTYVKHMRVTMDRLCNDDITRTAYLKYSPCFKKAYKRIEFCMNYFFITIHNNTMINIGGNTGSTKPQLISPEHFICEALSNMTTCAHNAVKCEERSSRTIKDILNLMLSGGLSTSLQEQCSPMIRKKPFHLSSVRSSASGLRPPGLLCLIKLSLQVRAWVHTWTKELF